MKQRQLLLSTTLTVVDTMTVHVLIVEDEAILAKNIDRFLIRQGYLTTVVHSISAALAEVPTGQVDIVLLDIELPDGNGLEAYPRLCQSAPLPTIAMTGCPRPEYRQRARELRLHDFLLKPFPLALLAEQIQALSSRSRRICNPESTDETTAPASLKYALN